MKPTFTQVSVWMMEIEQLIEDAASGGKNTAGLERMQKELEVLKEEVLKEFTGKQDIIDVMITLS